jgi:UDPglucose 6-dehydrogenase
LKVGIIGHGYVGRGMERLFSGAYEVAVFDTVTRPDDTILSGSELIVICVPTPANAKGGCDLTMVQDAARRATSLCPGTLVCVKSAVPPGTIDDLNRQYTGGLFHVSPEYLGEGPNFVPPWEYPDSNDVRSHDFVIVGGPRATEVLDFFQRVMATTARYVACSAVEAELTKRVENAFLATKVTFCNEMARIAESYGVNWHTLRELWLLDSRVGRSHTAVFAGRPGFGGKCLPKDLAALIVEAEAVGYDPSLLKAVRSANDRHRS